jgi:hypothetical protein
MIFTPEDAAILLDREEFRRFLLAAIQTAGLLGHHAPANGQLGSDLGHFEGRRSLGFDLLAMIDLGQPEPLRSPEAIATINQALREALNPKESKRERRSDISRYGELPDE